MTIGVNVTVEPAFACDNRTVQLDGAKLVARRRALSLSREQLADSAGGAHRLSVATIKRAESGAPVYLETARRLSGLLGVCSLTDLIQDRALESQSPCGALEARTVGVVVVPFRAFGPDVGASVLADGITEDLTTRLSNYWFPVIAYGSALRCRDSYSVEQLISNVDAGYVVEGSVQRVKDTVRVHARLTEAKSARSAWAREYTRSFSDLLSLQDELANGIVAGVNHRLLELQAQGFEHRHPDDLESWQLVARGSQLYYRYTAESNSAARTLLRSAVERDEDAAHAWYLLALTYQQDLFNQWTAAPRQALAELLQLSTVFKRLHVGDARADVIAAYARIYQGQREVAREHVARALENAASLHTAYSLLGQIVAMAGQPHAALEHLEIAMRLNPLGPDLWLLKTVVALAYFVAEDYAQSIAWANAASELRPDASFPFGTIAVGAALSGDIERARSAAQRMSALSSGGSDGFALLVASTEPAIAARYAQGLRLAGVSI